MWLNADNWDSGKGNTGSLYAIMASYLLRLQNGFQNG